MDFTYFSLFALLACTLCDHAAEAGRRALGAVLTGSPNGGPGSYGLSSSYGNGGYPGAAYPGAAYNGYSGFNNFGNAFNRFGFGYNGAPGPFSFGGASHVGYGGYGGYGFHGAYDPYGSHGLRRPLATVAGGSHGSHTEIVDFSTKGTASYGYGGAVFGGGPFK